MQVGGGVEGVGVGVGVSGLGGWGGHIEGFLLYRHIELGVGGWGFMRAPGRVTMMGLG